VGTKIPKFILDLAKKMDTPEMRKLYREQKLADETLDDRVEQFTEEIKDLFDHLEPPNGSKKAGKSES